MTDENQKRRLVVASNRLPVVLTRKGNGSNGSSWHVEPGSGGLVTAVEPVVKRRGGVWVGWPGTTGEKPGELESVLDEVEESKGYRISPVPLTADERDDFYLGFSNQVIWPLFHDFQNQCNFEPRFWEVYRRVNERFADVLEEEIQEGDFVWVHDYHLMAVARELRERDVEEVLGFFLHIPFPPLDLFVKLPWRFTILDSLLQFDLVGFQSARDRRNFLDCVEQLAPNVSLDRDGQTDRRVIPLEVDGRTVRAGVFPVSNDFEEFAGLAATSDVSERVARLRTEFAGRQVILGVDRLDYSKGIPHKLKGYRLALERYPDLRGNMTLVQLVVPSREEIPEYYRMKWEIEQLVGEIQGEFTRPGWVPIHYQYGRWERPELIAHYRTAAVALVTPLKDGMNLVAKEYCTCSLEGSGVLILSEYAGATAQLQHDALLVNPYDVEGVADAIHNAFTMAEEERRSRMTRMREVIRKYDIRWWVDTFMKAADGEDLGEDAALKTFRPTPPPNLF
ncbi:MAG: trehalose-6-phosphate synthase [Longimicrobiales bacterium]|nr:trehalose-6-phosphate synthase [Longimicrobiales bacterium]